MTGNGRPMRFGVFEVDLHTGEVRKQGLRIKLRDQPFQVLLLLLAHPGEVVSRDELQKQLWPANCGAACRQTEPSRRRSKAKFVRPRGFGNRLGNTDVGQVDVRLSGSAVVDTCSDRSSLTP